MGTIAKVFTTTRNSRKIRKNSCWQERMLYSLLLYDDLYGIAYNRSVGESCYRNKKFFGSSNELNFFMLKRLTKKLRRSIFLCTASNVCTKEIRVVQEILIIVFNLILTVRSNLEGANEWNSYRSIHSIFPSIEDTVCNFNKSLDFVIPHSVHPENLIRIFRRRTSDIPFIHLLRLLFYREKSIIFLNTPSKFHLRNNNFHYFLWNYRIHEFEYSLLNAWKRIYQFHSITFRISYDRISFARKVGNIAKQLHFFDKSVAKKSYSMHYVRYRNNSIVSMSTDTELPINFWSAFLKTLWEKYFHSWLGPRRICIINLSKNTLFFSGYTIRTETKSVTTRTQLFNYSIDTDSITEEFCGTIPIVSLIESLAKEKFCDTLGRPICKLPWTTLADNEIFERFNVIVKNLFCYYSGCFEKKGLYQLQYILRFSCAKTLACKHKSTIRTVWKKYGSNFATNFVFSRETKRNSSNSWQIHSRKRNFWYLNIVQINYLSNLLQKLEVRDLKR